MDPAIIAALSGAPATVVLLYAFLAQLKDRRKSEKGFLRALKGLEGVIHGQSALLLVIIERIAPGRSEELKKQVRFLFRAAQAIDDDDEQDDDET